MIKKFEPKIYVPSFEPLNHRYQDESGNDLDSVTQILKNELDSFNWGTVNASNRGTHVDRTCELWDKKDLDEKTLDPLLNPYLEQYKIALKNEGIEVLQNQVRRYHHKYKYAGTLDKIVKVKGELGILDLKTGYNYKQYKWQLSAYENMMRHELGATKRFSLRLNPTKYTFKEYTGTRDFLEFLALLAAFNIKLNNGYISKKRR